MRDIIFDGELTAGWERYGLEMSGWVSGPTRALEASGWRDCVGWKCRTSRQKVSRRLLLIYFCIIDSELSSTVESDVMVTACAATGTEMSEMMEYNGKVTIPRRCTRSHTFDLACHRRIRGQGCRLLTLPSSRVRVAQTSGFSPKKWPDKVECCTGERRFAPRRR